ncbi:MAG: tRNA 2-selenouridine(34) synthase MnmH [Pelovirga sp.]
MQATIELEAALRQRREGALFIDVRTPAEYHETTIPGAINVPLFNNEERAEIGLLYKQQGKMAARRRGVILAAPRIPALVEQVDAARQGSARPVVAFCWRGGMRSLAMASFMNLAGIPTRQLTGGHKAFRRQVCAAFAQTAWPPIYVLRGLTGVGKTRILQLLEQRGYPTIDLEGLANHRGSAFGALGLAAQPSQKLFEARLWDRLDQLSGSPYLITEGESRHIGRLRIPESFHRAMQEQTSLWLSTSMAQRTAVILGDYPALAELTEPIAQALGSLKERLGNAAVGRLQQLLAEQDWETLIAELMVSYYDPLYLHTMPARRIDIAFTSLDQGTDKVVAAIADLHRKH